MVGQTMNDYCSLDFYKQLLVNIDIGLRMPIIVKISTKHC